MKRSFGCRFTGRSGVEGRAVGESWRIWSSAFVLVGFVFATGMSGSQCNVTPPGPGPGPNPGTGARPQITPSDHILGDPNAPVTVVEYSDFECPFCGKYARESYPTIKQRYVDTGKIRYVFRHFPLPQHNAAPTAHRASECAADQGLFFEFHDEVFRNQSDLSLDQMKRNATNVGLNRTTFDPCAEGMSKEVRVQTDVNSGTALGVSSTPTFFVENEVVRGFQTADQLSTVIERHLP